MKKTDLKKIKGNFEIYSNGEYVVLSGAKLYILKPDGSLIACRNDLRYVGRITFLPGNRMLLCSSKAVFHMIDLCTGGDLWNAPYVKSNLNVHKFAVSPDGSFAYTYDEYRGNHFISRLFLSTPGHEVDVQDMHMDLGATCGILCDADGIPCLLKTLSETVGGKRVNQSGVRIHDFDGLDPGGTTTWKAKWTFEDRTSISFWGSTNRILTSDLCLYDAENGSLTPLLTPDANKHLPQQTILECWPDSTGRYLCIKYHTGNVIVDTRNRCIAAQYAGDCRRGCLIGDEYWICASDGVCRKPFPAMEALPSWEPSASMDWYFSKHPEQW